MFDDATAEVTSPSSESIAESSADSQQAASENPSDGFISSNDLKAELALGLSQFHNYRKHLKINCYKRGTRAYFSPEQSEAMRSLYAYIQQGGNMASYPRPEPSGPGEWEEEESGGLTYSTAHSPSPRTGNKSKTPGYLTDINPDRVKALSSAHAKEILISRKLGEKLADNPELLSEEDLAQVKSFEASFDRAFPVKEFSPESLIGAVIPNFRQEEGEEAELLE